MDGTGEQSRHDFQICEHRLGHTERRNIQNTSQLGLDTKLRGKMLQPLGDKQDKHAAQICEES